MKLPVLIVLAVLISLRHTCNEKKQEPIEATIEISLVAVGAMENKGSGIYYPTMVEVLVSVDGNSFTKTGEIDQSFHNNGYVGLEDFKVEFEARKARFIKVKVTNLAHPPTGGSAFMFLDEVVVE